MKTAVSPRLYGDAAIGKTPVAHPVGCVTFASFGRIIEAMKKAGELRTDAEVIGVTVEPNGLVFELR